MQVTRLLSWQFPFRRPGAGPVTGTYTALPQWIWWSVTLFWNHYTIHSVNRYTLSAYYIPAPSNPMVCAKRQVSWCHLLVQHGAPIQNVSHRHVTVPLSVCLPTRLTSLKQRFLSFSSYLCGIQLYWRNTHWINENKSFYTIVGKWN